jgi:hypothetical protein
MKDRTDLFGISNMDGQDFEETNGQEDKTFRKKASVLFQP